MSARDDYPALTSSVSGVLYISDVLEVTRDEGRAALDEIDRLRAEVKVLRAQLQPSAAEQVEARMERWAAKDAWRDPEEDET